ncbi:putative subunit of the multisubunit Na+/H+ antiporter [Leptolyngbya sp. PCC 7375]|nr:putative subunit of the multisubunit Na+/H+ antiporter [Leptolyngbya sp. PCC 7375]
MTEDIYTVAILLLLPMTASMLVSQVNPYNALVIRGILGAVAALVYAMFGAADVALTEALVGTMLSITLYAVAVRSSMSMRLGVIEAASSECPGYEALLSSLRTHLQEKHLRLEVIPFTQTSTLQTALANKEIHAVFMVPNSENSDQLTSPNGDLQIRVRRLYEILQAKLSHELVNLRFADVETANLSRGKGL